MAEIAVCTDCHREFPKKALNRKGRCSECARKKGEAIGRQLHAHSGPEYENWKLAIKAAAEKL